MKGRGKGPKKEKRERGRRRTKPEKRREDDAREGNPICYLKIASIGTDCLRT